MSSDHHSTTNPSGDNPPIKARTLLGDELTLKVYDRCTLICVQSEPTGHELIMTTDNAVKLVMEILGALGGRLVGGPISGAY